MTNRSNRKPPCSPKGFDIMTCWTGDGSVSLLCFFQDREPSPVFFASADCATLCALKIDKS